jgi:hypothetical protein
MSRNRREWNRRMNMGDRTWEEKKEEKKQKTLDDWEKENEANN